jgi:hypothetical protein
MSDAISMREASTGEILAKLQEHVILVAMHIGWPKMSPHIADSSVVLTDGASLKQVNEKFRSSPRWNLIPDEWKSRLGSLESRARKCLSNYARQFTSKGLNLLPISRAEEVFRQLKVMQEEFLHIAEQFTENYTDILQDVRRELESEIGHEAVVKAMKALPDPDKIKDCFRFQWYSLPLSSSVSEEKIRLLQFQLEELIRDYQTPSEIVPELQKIRATVAELSRIAASDMDASQTSELMQEARAALRDQIGHVVDDLIEGPRRQVAAEMATLIQKLQDDKQIQPGSFTALRDAIQHLRDFEFLETPQLEQALLAVDRKISEHAAKQLNESRDLSLQLANALTTQVGKIVDPQDMRQASQRFRRHVHVHVPDPEPVGA